MADNQHQNKRPIRLFYSYSHDDEALRLRLEKHLSVLRWNGLIAEWHDRMIGAGDDWENAIDDNLEKADVVLLLLSASFLGSPYCWSKEMAKALERHARQEARVIPVILQPCRWMSTRLKVLQAVPKDAKPVTTWRNEDEAFDDVAARIEAVVEELRKENQTTETGVGAPKSNNETPNRSGADLYAALTSKPPQPLLTNADHGSLVDATPLPSREPRTAVDKPNASKPQPKNGVYIGADWRDLPDFAVFKDIEAAWCPEMVVIPAGTFLMGSPPGEAGRDDDEGPQHQVTISRRFAIGRFAVTFGEYDHFCEATTRTKPEDRGWGRGQRPVINVSWQDAQDYLEWLSQETGHSYRLPTEAEWEYACRAGTTTPFSFGVTGSPEQVNYHGNYPYAGGKKGLYREQTIPVGTLPANAWGLYEMHGNVWEWCPDGKRNYTSQAVTDPMRSIAAGAKRVLRGGSWNDYARHVRSASRDGDDPGGRHDSIGFRLARVQEP